MPERCLGSTSSRNCWLTYADQARQTLESSIRGSRQAWPGKTSSATDPRSRGAPEAQAWLDLSRPPVLQTNGEPKAVRTCCPSSKGWPELLRGGRLANPVPPNTQQRISSQSSLDSCVRPRSFGQSHQDQFCAGRMRSRSESPSADCGAGRAHPSPPARLRPIGRARQRRNERRVTARAIAAYRTAT